MITADLHLHSPFARAVSPRMSLTGMVETAWYKGLNILATGDWTHPIWLAKLQQELVEKRPGIFALKSAYQPKNISESIRASTPQPVFILSTEISCIYSQGGKVRRVHLLVMVPSFASMQKIISELQKRGANLHADGRPIIGMSCHDLAELVLTIENQALIIPAHAWTPWFGVLGSKGGFDSLEEAFGDVTDQIYAIETGLSSDPAMNWKIPQLDNVAIVSFSDAHSPEKLGREVTVFDGLPLGQVEYRDVYRALAETKLGKNKSKLKLRSTVEFYPQEGKYHWDGHRACGIAQSPSITREKGIKCPVCGKPLTIGVEFRVDELSAKDRLDNKKLMIDKKNKNGLIEHYNLQSSHRQPFTNLLPLNEIIAQVTGKQVGTETVKQQYHDLVTQVGNEWQILLEFSPAQLTAKMSVPLAAAIMRVRAGELTIDPGYDGVYGKVALTNVPAKNNLAHQAELF